MKEGKEAREKEKQQDEMGSLLAVLQRAGVQLSQAEK